jgi:benzylsuccinate CoA-transferase BbsF subunit
MIPAAPPRAADGNYLVLPVADGFVRILPAGRRHWRGLVDLLDRADAFAAPEWDFALYRMVNHDAIRLIAADALLQRTRAEVFAAARARNVPLAPIHTPDEFAASEQSRARGTFKRAGGVLGDAPVAVAPFRFSRTPVATPAPPQPCPIDAVGWSPPAPRAAPAADAGALLAGTRVVVFGYAVVAPELGTLLAELGADVIRVESRASLDLLRQITIEPDTPNRAFTFNDASRGHRSACFDLRHPRGRALALDLCASADIVAENYRGGALHHHGIDYATVSARRPDVIYLSSQGYGATGPLAEAPAFGPLNASYCGVQWLWNHPASRYPAGTSLNHPDHIASKLAAVGVLAALEHRRRTGEGQYIDMAQTEAAAFLIGDVYLRTAGTGVAPRQVGNDSDDVVPHGVYPSAGDDRWIAIAAAGDAAWQRLARCCGWAEDPSLATLAGRLAARAAIDARLAEWTRARDAETAATTLQAAGVSAMAVLGPDELRADRHLQARQAIVTVEHPEIGPERHIGTPLRMSRPLLSTAGTRAAARRGHGGCARAHPRRLGSRKRGSSSPTACARRRRP